MKMKRNFNNYFLSLLLSLPVFQLEAQITAGKITYERKTNLYKKFTGDSKDWIKEKDKTKIDTFELYFNDTLSVFKPQESELVEKFSWTTRKNTVYQNFKTNKCLSIKDIWGEKLYVSDTLRKRTWKITDSHRSIGGFNCRKAIWQVNDTSRIYAWYADGIMVNTGPESFNGLPGMILGLATEDGGIIYFAKTVELSKPEATQLTVPKTKEKIYTTTELRKKLEENYGKEKWGKEMIKETFDVW